MGMYSSIKLEPPDWLRFIRVRITKKSTSSHWSNGWTKMRRSTIGQK
jgi:hypothetical protein